MNFIYKVKIGYRGDYTFDELMEEPTIEIVRCKDCDNTVPNWYMKNGKKVEVNWCVEMESNVDDDEYCSRAVPKGSRAKMKGGTE